MATKLQEKWHEKSRTPMRRVAMKTFGNLQSGLIIVGFSTLALIYLFMVAKKKKAYPAMPYLTTGILLGMLIAYLIA